MLPGLSTCFITQWLSLCKERRDLHEPPSPVQPPVPKPRHSNPPCLIIQLQHDSLISTSPLEKKSFYINPTDISNVSCAKPVAQMLFYSMHCSLFLSTFLWSWQKRAGKRWQLPPGVFPSSCPKEPPASESQNKCPRQCLNFPALKQPVYVLLACGKRGSL